MNNKTQSPSNEKVGKILKRMKDKSSEKKKQGRVEKKGKRNKAHTRTHYTRKQ